MSLCEAQHVLTRQTHPGPGVTGAGAETQQGDAVRSPSNSAQLCCGGSALRYPGPCPSDGRALPSKSCSTPAVMELKIITNHNRRKRLPLQPHLVHGACRPFFSAHPSSVSIRELGTPVLNRLDLLLSPDNSSLKRPLLPPPHSSLLYPQTAHAQPSGPHRSVPTVGFPRP